MVCFNVFFSNHPLLISFAVIFTYNEKIFSFMSTVNRKNQSLTKLSKIIMKKYVFSLILSFLIMSEMLKHLHLRHRLPTAVATKDETVSC